MGLRKEKAELQEKIDELAKGVEDLRRDIQHPAKENQDSFKYFVSYSQPKGFGCCVLYRTKEITSIDDIVSIIKFMEEKLSIKGISILYWRKFEGD